MLNRKFIFAVVLTFVTLEVTAAAWHLLFFWDFYADQLAAIARPFAEYRILFLITNNLLRALVLTLLFVLLFQRIPPTLRNGLLWGSLIGLVCGLMVGEYYGVWAIKSLAWVVVEGLWSVLQGASVGLVNAWLLRGSTANVRSVTVAQ